jgi:hypothetical protein
MFFVCQNARVRAVELASSTLSSSAAAAHSSNDISLSNSNENVNMDSSSESTLIATSIDYDSAHGNDDVHMLCASDKDDETQLYAKQQKCFHTFCSLFCSVRNGVNEFDLKVHDTDMDCAPVPVHSSTTSATTPQMFCQLVQHSLNLTNGS